MKLSETLQIDLSAGVLLRAQEQVHLTANEQAVLRVLIRAKGRVVSRGQLNLDALGYRPDSSSRALDATIRRLRKKIEPDPDKPIHLLSVYGKGYRLEASSDAPEAPNPTPSDARPAWHATRFVGRGEELQAVAEALRTNPHVALCGVSGVGKSRLAAEYLQRQRDMYPAGYAWVDLGGASSLTECLQRIATAVGLAARHIDPERLSQEIAAALRASDPLLIVVDGADEMTEPLAVILRSWQRGAAHHMVLTTRLQSGLEGWTRHTLAGLPHASALELLRDRSERSLTVDEASAGELVQQLDGLPLAIEFAASRIRLLGVRGVLEALQQGSRAESPALVEAVAWAFGTLTPSAQRALEHATVFEEPFDWFAFELVCSTADNALADLEALLDRCLIRRHEDQGRVRFSVYGAVKRLLQGAPSAARARHAAWLGDLARNAPQVWSIRADYMTSTRRSLRDWLAAWQWANRSDPELAATLVLGLSPYLHHAGPTRLHLDILQQTQHPELDSATIGRLHLAEAAVHMSNADPGAARACLVAAARTLPRGTSPWRARLRHLIGKVEWHRKPNMEIWFEESVQIFHEAKDAEGAALVQADLAQRLLSRAIADGTPQSDTLATGHLATAEALADASRNPQAELLVDWSKSYLHRAEGRLASARVTLESVRDRFVELGSVANAYSVEMSLAHLAWWSIGDFLGLATHIRAARRIAAGFVAGRLELVEAAAYYEAVLDERARPGLVRALTAPGADQAPDDLLTVRIRLALLDCDPVKPEATIATLTLLAEDAHTRSDWMAVSECEVATALLWARASKWEQALHALEHSTPSDPTHPAAATRDRLVRVLSAAARVALGAKADTSAFDEARASGPGRLCHVVAALTGTTTSRPDHAPRGSLLPHELWFAKQAAAQR